MTDKERFEEIKHFVDLIDFIPRDDRGMGEMDVNNVKNDMEWLIGRVQELERELEEHKSKFTVEYTMSLRKRNKRYREALEFYADEETYETKFATDTDEIFDPFTLIELDEGKKARKALEVDLE